MDKRIKPQSALALTVIQSDGGDADSIAMGVLDDGTPFLTARGLARLCGVAPSVIITLGSNWGEESAKPRGLKISSSLRANGVDDKALFIETEVAGVTTHAYSDGVAAAIIEYYAFERGKREAQNAMRLLMRKTLRDFIYERVGYKPGARAAIAWDNYQKLVTANAAPVGYFNVLQESSKLMIDGIRQGLPIDPATVPDISIGRTWADYWKNSGMERKYGTRKKHQFEYPAHYPQSVAEIEHNVYPIKALGEFRQWLDTEYLPKKFPAYLKRKMKEKKLSETAMKDLLDALVTPLLQ